MEEFTYPLQRTRSMNILGHLWTGSISGQIIVIILLSIGLLFMHKLEYSILSIVFFLGFFAPFSFIFHARFVRKGKQLMKNFCDVRYDKETKALTFRTGFPNTNDPTWQQIIIDEKVLGIEIRGNEIGGFHMRLLVKEEKGIEDIVRLGLFLDLDEIKTEAEKLGKIIDKPVSVNIKAVDEGTKQ